MHFRRAAFVISVSALALTPLVAFAWTGPTQSPPGGNVAAPVNVGTTDQVKNSALGVNSLAVFGNSLFGGSTGSNAYLNFGATTGTNGYGIRDNAGLLEFKNSGGSWESIQATVFNLVGGTGSWTASGDNISNSNSGNVGIKTSSPTAPLTVRQVNNTQGGGNAGFRVENTSGTGITQILTGGDNASYIFNGTGNNYMVISTAGNVGIGMQSSSEMLSVAGNVLIRGTKPLYRFYDPTQPAGYQRAQIQHSGVFSLSMGPTNDAWGWTNTMGNNRGVLTVMGAGVDVDGILQVGGNVTTQAGILAPHLGNGPGTYPVCWNAGSGELTFGAACSASDIRLKTNIRNFTDGLQKVQALRPVNFEWKDKTRGTGNQIGLIAQEVEKIVPEVVSTSADGIKSIDYAKLTPVLIKGMQEQQAEIDNLKAQVAQLQSNL